MKIVEIRHYECTSGGSSKDYTILACYDDKSTLATGGMVARRWGKIGSAGQSKKSEDLWIEQVSSELRREDRNRAKKGYKLQEHLKAFDIRDLSALVDRHPFMKKWMAKDATLHRDLQAYLGSQSVEPSSPQEPYQVDESIDRGEAWGSW